jgi:hypothetical protein
VVVTEEAAASEATDVVVGIEEVDSAVTGESRESHAWTSKLRA